MSNAAHDVIAAALDARPNEIQRLVMVTRQAIDVLPKDTRHGAVLFLLSSLVAVYADDPKRAVAELAAHVLDAAHVALMSKGSS